MPALPYQVRAGESLFMRCTGCLVSNTYAILCSMCLWRVRVCDMGYERSNQCSLMRSRMECKSEWAIHSPALKQEPDAEGACAPVHVVYVRVLSILTLKRHALTVGSYSHDTGRAVGIADGKLDVFHLVHVSCFLRLICRPGQSLLRVKVDESQARACRLKPVLRASGLFRGTLSTPLRVLGEVTVTTCSLAPICPPLSAECTNGIVMV